LKEKEIEVLDVMATTPVLDMIVIIEPDEISDEDADFGGQGNAIKTKK
jgi:hypothetical protein